MQSIYVYTHIVNEKKAILQNVNAHGIKGRQTILGKSYIYYQAATNF